jgi:hypothetical protein
MNVLLSWGIFSVFGLLLAIGWTSSLNDAFALREF